MAIYRKVYRKMWTDKKVKRLSPMLPSGQCLWFWLLTGPATTQIPGVVIGDEDMLVAQLKWPIEGFRKAFDEVLGEGMAKADLEAGIIWLPKGIDHNPPGNPNVVTSWRHTWNDLPESPLQDIVHKGLTEYLSKMSPKFLKAFEKACPKDYRNQDQEQDQDQDQEQDICPPAAGPDQPPVDLFSPNDTENLFSHFWEKFPRKANKKKARKAYEDRLHEGINPQRILDWLDWYIHNEWKGRPDNGTDFPYPQTFLNSEDFADDPSQRISGSGGGAGDDDSEFDEVEKRALKYTN